MTEYTPTVWQDSDAITAEKLNKIENRIEEIQSMERVWGVYTYSTFETGDVK